MTGGPRGAPEFQGTPSAACGALAAGLLTPSSPPSLASGHARSRRQHPPTTTPSRQERPPAPAPTADRMSLQVPMHPKAAGAGKDTKAVILVRDPGPLTASHRGASPDRRPIPGPPAVRPIMLTPCACPPSRSAARPEAPASARSRSMCPSPSSMSPATPSSGTASRRLPRCRPSRRSS